MHYAHYILHSFHGGAQWEITDMYNIFFHNPYQIVIICEK